MQKTKGILSTVAPLDHLGLPVPKTFFYGAGGLSREIYSLLLDSKSDLIDDVGLVVDPSYLESNTGFNQLPVYSIEEVPDKEVISLVLALGSNNARNAFVFKMSHHMATWPTLIHPKSSVGFESSLGTGSVILAGVTITAGCEIGDFTLVNPNTSISHDCTIGSFVSIGPGTSLAGNVTVGDNVEIGVGAVILPGISISSNARIGAGAVVTKNVEPWATVVGNPAKLHV